MQVLTATSKAIRDFDCIFLGCNNESKAVSAIFMSLETARVLENKEEGLCRIKTSFPYCFEALALSTPEGFIVLDIKEWDTEDEE